MSARRKLRIVSAWMMMGWLVAPLSFGASVTVLIEDNGFTPATITINQGDEVFWFNDGALTHTVVASGAWNSGRLQPLDFYATVLTQLGTFPYACTLHPGETGAVTVVPSVIPPSVSIFYPADGTSFGQPATFRFQVLASDSDGSVNQVQFFDGDALLGTDAVMPYDLSVSNLPPGGHRLTASATDNQGYVGRSASANILITSAAAVAGASRFVDIRGAQFMPSLLHVTVGDTVVFRNLDASNHTATGVFTSREALCGSTQITADRSCTNTFLTPGTFAYFCGLHPVERGTIVVNPASNATPLKLFNLLVTATGEFQFDVSVPPGLACVIQSADSLPSGWVSLQTNVATNGFVRFVDPGAATLRSRRFFRAVIQP